MNISLTLPKSLPTCPSVCFRKKSTCDKLPDLQTNLDGINFREASSIDDYISCFRLLHDVYVEAGFIEPSSVPLRIIPHHSDPEARVFMRCPIDTQTGKRPIYTVSLFPDNEQGLPMDIGFKREVGVLRKQKRRLVEVGCLASHPEFRKGDKKIPMLGNRMVVSYAVNVLHADDLLITVHPKYLKIYEDILLFEKIGQISSYSYVNDNPAVALRQNLKTWPQRLKKVYGKNPIEKNLYHFLFESEPTSTDLPLATKTIADNKDLVIKGINSGFLANLWQIGCPTHENLCSYFMNFREELLVAG